MGHQTEFFAYGRDGITNLADYTHKFAGADTKFVRPVIGLPGAGQTDTASLPHVQNFGPNAGVRPNLQRR